VWLTLSEIVGAPSAFFEKRIHSNVGLWESGVVVLSTGLFFLLALVALGDRIINIIPEDAVFFFVVIHIFSTIGSLLGSVVLWPLLALAVHAIACYLNNKDCSLRPVLDVIGWSYLPMLMYGGVLVLVTFMWPIPSNQVQTVDQLQVVLEHSRFMVVSNHLRSVFLAWGGILAITGIRILFQTSWTKASISVLTPIGTLWVSQWLLLLIWR
jgi:hypothetical protein